MKKVSVSNLNTFVKDGVLYKTQSLSYPFPKKFHGCVNILGQRKGSYKCFS